MPSRSNRRNERSGSGPVGKPIDFTGVHVARDDLVVADGDSVIIVPAAEAERTILAGEERAAREAAMMQQLADDAKTLDLLGLTHWRTLK